MPENQGREASSWMRQRASSVPLAVIAALGFSDAVQMRVELFLREEKSLTEAQSGVLVDWHSSFW